MRGTQCHKSLYLNKYFPQWRDAMPESKKAIFKRGINVGLLAQKMFKGGVDVSAQKFKYAEAVQRTQEEIKKGTKVIYEATFMHNQVLVMVDILVSEDNSWYAYEVKSSARVSATYIADAALQYFVITQSGLPLADFFLMHINNKYVKNGAVEVEQLFSKVSVKEEAEKTAPLIAEKIEQFKNVLSKEAVPEINIGAHCYQPYECDFKSTCWRDIPNDSIFELGGMNKETQFELFNKGIVKITDINDEEDLSAMVKLQVKAQKLNAPIINKAAIKNFLSSIYYPLYFLDFETIMPAVPLFDNTSPYAQIPFQYSLHYIEKPGAPIKHFEFLAEHDIRKDPRHDFINQLLLDTLPKGDIIVYNATFERTVLNNLKQLFPELSQLIDQRITRLKDLMDPFRERHYYHPAMKGSYSIKYVLPALVNNLSYNNLKIQDGATATHVFEQLLYETDIFKIAETRDALMEYCRMDTLAMVKILEVLEGTVT